MYTTGFYKDMLERTISTFAQAFIAYAGTGVVGVLEFDWATAFSLAAMAAVLAVFKAFAFGAANPETGASVGTAVPRGTVAAVEEPKVEGSYVAEEAAPYSEGTPVDVVPDADRNPDHYH